MSTKWPDGEILRLLDEYGFVLIRTTKHMIYKNPQGKVYVCSATPSDVYAYKAALGELKRVVGINKTQSEPGERREKKRHNKPQPQPQTKIAESYVSRPSMQDQLANLFKK